MVRFIGQDSPRFVMRDLEKHEDEAAVVVIGDKTTFYPRLYQDASLNYLMDWTTKLSGIGQAAVSFSTTVRHKASWEPLLEEEVVLVKVDKRSFKPVPVDKGFVEKYGKCCDNVIPRIGSPSKPSGEDGMFHTQRQAVWSDIDGLNHVSQTNYLKFCLDAKSLFMKDNSYWSSLLVKQVTSMHKGEIKEGDIMDIYMWQSKYPNVLHFQIEVKSKVACNVTIEFYFKDICSKL